MRNKSHEPSFFIKYERAAQRRKENDPDLAIYHLEAKVISRGVGRTACGAAAYMSCSRIYNDYDGIQHDYTRKGGLVWEHIFLPPMAPAAWQDRETLWNAVEANEKTKDSQLAREFIVALPVELEQEQWIGLLTEFVQDAFVSDGMCADAAIHDADGHNPHAHILLTMRPLNQDGTWQYKTEKEYLCVRNGEERGFTAAEFKTAQGEGWEKQYQYKVGKKKTYLTPSAAEAQGLERASKYPKSTKYGRQNPITARWNSEEQLIAWRAAWAEHTNRWLERCGHDARIDHRSHAERGLDEKPTVHEGVTARKIENAGHVSERCELNRQIRADNAIIRALKSAVVKLKQAIETTVPAIAAAMETVCQNLIVFHYGLSFVQKRKKARSEYVTKAKRTYEDYTTLRGKIKASLDERKALQAELDALSVFNIGRRKELKAQLAALTEEIEDLRFKENGIMLACEKSDAAGMKQIEREITAAEADAVKLEKRETMFTDAIGKETERFTELKKQSAALDQSELIDARLALRPQMGDRAKERVRGAMSSGKLSFWSFQTSIRDVDVLLNEDGMAEQRELEIRRKARGKNFEPQVHKPKSNSIER